MGIIKGYIIWVESDRKFHLLDENKGFLEFVNPCQNSLKFFDDPPKDSKEHPITMTAKRGH